MWWSRFGGTLRAAMTASPLVAAGAASTVVMPLALRSTTRTPAGALLRMPVRCCVLSARGVTGALARICAHAEAFWAQKPMSSMASAGLLQGVPIKMFQYEICPFCNKIKTVLDFCKVCAPDRTRVRRHLAVRHSSATDMLSLC